MTSHTYIFDLLQQAEWKESSGLFPASKGLINGFDYISPCGKRCIQVGATTAHIANFHKGDISNVKSIQLEDHAALSELIF